MSLSILETVATTVGSDWAATSGRAGSRTTEKVPLMRCRSVEVRCIRITYEADGRIATAPPAGLAGAARWKGGVGLLGRTGSSSGSAWEDGRMRIATWNVNSIGARLPRLLDWLATRQPDVAALQETKCADAGFPFAEVEGLGYQAMHVGDGRWNGVAILSRVGLTPVADALPGMSEPRYAVADCAGLRVTSVYVPNGRAVDDPQYAYKLAWFDALRSSLDDVSPADPQVMMGDFNVARTDADVWD